jgi:hypothetical protein
MAKAAGLDAAPLEEQIRRQQNGDDDPDRLRARIAQLEQELAASVTETTPIPVVEGPQPPPAVQPTPVSSEQRLAEGLRAINASMTPSFSLGGDDVA